MELIFKVGNQRKPDDPLFRYALRGGQLINMRPSGFYQKPDGTPKADMTGKSFCVIEVDGDFYDLCGVADHDGLKAAPAKYLELKKYTSAACLGKQRWEAGYVEPIDALVRQRDYFIDYDLLKQDSLITPSQYDSIFNKDQNHMQITLDKSITDILKHEDIDTRINPDADLRSGTIDAGGTYTVGTAQTYADWSTAVADLPADLGAMTTPGNVTLQGNTTEEIAESTDIVLALDTDSYTIKLAVHDDHVHDGGAYGSGHRINFGTFDSITIQETSGNTLNNGVIEKLAINASGVSNYGIWLYDGGDSGHLIVDRCVIVGDVNSQVGIQGRYGADNVIIRNNSIYNFTKTPASSAGNGIEIRDDFNNHTYEIYNNTCAKNSRGVTDYAASPTGTLTIKNNLCVGNTDADFHDASSSFDTTAKNTSGDSSSPDGATYRTWAGTANMADYPNNDFRIVTTDPTLVDGDDLSGIGAPAQFDYDIENNARSTWFIGASELPAAAAGVEIFRRRIEGY